MKEGGQRTLIIPANLGYGARAQPRAGERRALVVSRLLRPLLPMKWRPSRATRIADALVDTALHPPPGRSVVDAGTLA